MQSLEERYAQASGDPEAFLALVEQCKGSLQEFQRQQNTLEGWEQSLLWVLALFQNIEHLPLLDVEDKYSLLLKHSRAMLCAIYRASSTEEGEEP